MSKCIDYLKQDTEQSNLFTTIKEDITNLIQKEGISSGCDVYCSGVGEITISISDEFSSSLIYDLNEYTNLTAKIVYSSAMACILLIYNISDFLDSPQRVDRSVSKNA